MAVIALGSGALLGSLGTVTIILFVVAIYRGLIRLFIGLYCQPSLQEIVLSKATAKILQSTTSFLAKL
jgi:hypothetical protein